jgi:ribosomal-protein-alanine N-acetyltransferase
MIFTNNLIIRKFTLSDSKQYYENNQDEQIKKFMPEHTHINEDEAHKEVASFIANYIELKMPCHWAIIKADTDMLIGHIGVGEADINGIENTYEICCAINKNYRGNNYAVEAVQAFVSWCKNTFDISKVYASTNQENIASRKTLLNAGFILCENEYVNKKPHLNVYIFS